MLVLSRTVWAKNSLLITVVDEMFSFVKIAGKLYKSCMCLILSQSRRCFFVRECMFLCSDKQSSVRFADVRRSKEVKKPAFSFNCRIIFEKHIIKAIEDFFFRVYIASFKHEGQLGEFKTVVQTRDAVKGLQTVEKPCNEI